jgi:hypothetical protein
VLGRFWRWLGSTWNDIGELEQRRILRAEPWREEFLHMGLDGQIHGRFVPPHGRHSYSVTSSGWCPGLREVS